LFGPKGEVLGRQPKLHAYTSEAEWLTCGTALETAALPFATVAQPVCMDHTFWETDRIAWLNGAEIIFNPSADAFAADYFLAVRGIQTRVQESPAYGVLTNLVTDLFGLNFCGPSRIVAPRGLCGDGRTILAQTQTSDREEIITADLDLARLREFRAAQTFDFNLALYEKYLPRVYAEYRVRREREGQRVVK
jgi:predicted amidohydrolase